MILKKKRILCYALSLEGAIAMILSLGNQSGLFDVDSDFVWFFIIFNFIADAIICISEIIKNAREQT